MDFKSIWTDADFELMNWRNCRLYAISMLDENFQISLNIDYMFEWKKETEFLISPCDMTFNNVSNVMMKFELIEKMFLLIDEIKKSNPRKSPNGKFIMWDYKIIFDSGSLDFTATDFKMLVKKPAISSESIYLGIKKRK